METVVSSKGQVVIPSALRRKYDIRKGTRMLVSEHDGSIVLQPANRRLIRSLRGSLKGVLTLDDLLAERARGRKREDEARVYVPVEV
jgi:AbrB family looped-hinge helix DNA binding protein